MPPLHPVRSNFTAGEISPRLYGRIDTNPYLYGLQECTNLIVMPQGGLTRRGGWASVSNAKNSNKNKKLIRWVFSQAAGQQYMLECGYDTSAGPYIRVHRVDTHVYGSVELTGSPLAWTDSDITNIRWVQQNDVMYLFDRVHPPLKLIRSGDTQPGTWTLTEETFAGSPFALSNQLEYKLFKYTNDYFFAAFGNGYTPSGFEHFFTQNPTITSGSIELYKADLHDTDLDYGPVAWTSFVGSINSESLSYLDVKERFSWMLTGYLDLPETALYSFGLAVNNSGDIHIDGSLVVSRFHDDGWNLFDNADMFTTSAQKSLAAGSHAFRARMMQEWNEDDFGIVVGYRKDVNQVNLLFNGTGTNNLSVSSTGKWKGRGIFEINVFISATDDTKWGWKYRYNGEAEDIAGNYSDWYEIIPEPGQALPVSSYVLTDPTGGRPGNGKTLATITLPSTSHDTDDNWTFKVGFNIIPYEMFERTQFVATDDYPGFGCFYQRRLGVAGFSQQPNVLKWSKVGFPNDFQFGTNDDDAFQVEISTLQNDVLSWMVAARRLLLGSASTEYAVFSEEQPITPKSFPIIPQTHNGSKYLEPIVTESGAVLFVEKSGKRLREFSYNLEGDSFLPVDMTIFSDHFVESGIKRIAYQKAGKISTGAGLMNLAWAVTDTGDLLSLTYEPQHKVYAWAVHNFKGATGKFLDVETVPTSSGGDEVWALVNDSDTHKVVYLKYNQPYDISNVAANYFEAIGIPLSFDYGDDKSSLLGYRKSWAWMKFILRYADTSASTSPRISDDLDAAYADMEPLDIAATITNNETIEHRLLGWNDTAQFKIIAKDYFTMIGMYGRLDVNER